MDFMMSGEVRTDVRAKRELKKHGWRWGRFCRWHLKHGWVVSVPDLFAAGYFYEENGKTVCRISYLRGSPRLLFRFSLNYFIDIVEFDRRFSGKYRRYAFKQLKKRF